MLASSLACAQNGLTTYAMPTGYTPSQLQWKSALVIDNAGNKWVGFQNIGLGKFDGTTWTMYDVSNSLLPSNKVQALAVDASNNIWIGTDNGLAKFDGTNWTVFTAGNSGIAGNNIRSLATLNGTWIGTTNGFSKYNGSVFTNYSVSNSGLAGDTVQCFSFEPNGSVWIGTSNGLSKFSNNTWSTFSSYNSGLISNDILSLYYQPGGNTWIGTVSGLCKYFQNTICPDSQFYPSVKNFFQAAVYSIARGPQGGIIFNSSRGCFIEVISTKPVMYYLTGISTSASFFAYDNTAQKLWFVNRLSSIAKDLYSFDYQAYLGLGLGYTFDNLKFLDINEVSAPIQDDPGFITWGYSGYQAPKAGGIDILSNASMWMGGFDQSGNLHMAADYGPNYFSPSLSDFWPGPLDTTNAGIDSITANNYDRVWRVDRFKVAEFIYNFNNGNVQNGTYFPDEDFITWPTRGNGNLSRKLAPYVDVNGNGIYDPMTGGDYPDISGDEELWWICNDKLGTHDQTGGQPFGVEVQAHALDFTCPSLPDSLKVMNYTTLYRMVIINRSSNDYDSVHIGLFEDANIGLYSDDYVGCYAPGNFGFTYNADADDGGGAPGTYGLHPPMLSQQILNGPPAYSNDGKDNDNDGIVDEPGEKDLMTSFVYYNNDFSANGNPTSDTSYYNYCRGLHKNGAPYIDCNSNPTTFCFSGLPSDTNSCSEGNIQNPAGDRRFLMGCGPFKLHAGDTATIDFAIIFSRDTNLVYGSQAYYQLMVDDNRRVRDWYNANYFPSCLPMNVGIPEENIKDELAIYPNPSDNVINIQYTGSIKNISATIFDITGKEIMQLNASQLKSSIDVSSLPSGLYLIRVSDGVNMCTKKFVKN
jgi:hypothetical protein